MTTRAECNGRYAEVPARFGGAMLSVVGAAMFTVAQMSLSATAVRAADCNLNGRDDAEDIEGETSSDCDRNGVPDECDLAPRLALLADGSYPAAGGARFVAASDLDRDGDLDLAVAAWTSNAVSVLLNRGDGTFGPSTDLEAGNWPWAVTAADIDGDGDEDLLLPNRIPTQSDDTVTILRNRGDGTFDPPVAITVGDSPRYAAPGDLDGDGDLDLAVPNDHSRDVSIVLGDGRGGFAPPVSYAASGFGHSADVADLDGDGDLDVAVACEGGAGTAGSVFLLWNRGDGAFPLTGSLASEHALECIRAADLDGDGDEDLIAAGGGAASIFQSDGKGGFLPPEPIPTSTPSGVGPEAVAIVDLDGDARPDVALGGMQGLTVALSLGGDDPENALMVELEPVREGISFSGVAAADIDGDGRPELLGVSEVPSEVIVAELAERPPERTDCNANGRVDACDIESGTSLDANGDGIPDDCNALRRGDPNGDGSVNITDPIAILEVLFLGVGALACEDGADADDSGSLEITDPIYLLGFLFLGGPPPEAPFASCGPDPSFDSIRCASYPPCE
jgi:hypothetical protein